MRTKVGAGEIGGIVEEEIFGNHSNNISNNTKGRHGEDVDIIVGGNETRQINGTLDISVRSNIFATSLEGNFDMAAKENMSLQTQSGILSAKSGTTLNIKSVETMTVKSEADIDMDSTTETDITAGTLMDLNAGSEIDADAPTINLN